jgi:hypothetical protein
VDRFDRVEKAGPKRLASGLISFIMTLNGKSRLPVCSNMCSSPPGFSTRYSAFSPATGLGTEQNVQEVNAWSNEPSGNSISCTSMTCAVILPG